MIFQTEASAASTSKPRISAAALLSVFNDLLSLTKPKVISLLLVSTLCPMFLAAGREVPARTAFWAVVAGALISGSAGAINCIWDRDIDLLMQRTQDRPIPAGRLSTTTAAVFSLIIGLLGLLFMAWYVNVLAAAVALFGHLFYVFVYTIWLKRITPQNIVIGGAAGAVPPIVGWVAMTGEIALPAVLLFLLVFLWTPPHFWALALNKNGDYQRAGVPMLPVVAGEKATHNQMLCYALSLIPVSLLLILSCPRLGWFSYVVLLGLSVTFAFKVLKLKLIAESEPALKIRKAWDVFGFSLIYLALYFVCLVVDSTMV